MKPIPVLTFSFSRITDLKHKVRSALFPRRTLFLLLSLCLLSPRSARAGSGTWLLDPVNNDWNTAANWSSGTVPNGPDDVATFAVSETTDIFVTAATELNAWTFAPEASPYFTTVNAAILVTLSGSGIANDSSNSQTIFARADAGGVSGTVLFTGTAAAEGPVSFITEGSPTNNFANGGVISFHDSSSASNCTFVNEGATALGAFGGRLQLSSTSHLSDCEITNEAGTADAANGAWTTFENTSTAADCMLTSRGANVSGALGGRFWFFESTAVVDSVLVAEGATIAGGKGGEIFFDNFSSAGNATLIATGGTNGGEGGFIRFVGYPQTDSARIEVFGNGTFDASDVLNRQAPTIIGSLEGDGIAVIGTILGKETLRIGTNNLSTLFSGDLQEDPAVIGTGAIEKVGTGMLTLSGANSYGAGTTVSGGALIAANTTGSATGTGAITVTAGTLGGNGIISGPVTIGTNHTSGATLAPAFGSNKQVTLTLQSSLTLQVPATYTYTFKARKNQARTDLVIANGITINDATIALQGQTQGRVKLGTVLTVLSNTSANAISGTFSNLADGAIVTIDGNKLQASYSGGDGNDLTLTVVQ